MRRLVLDGYSHILRLSGVPELQSEIEQAIERALEEDPDLLLCSSQIAYREFLRHLVVPLIFVRDALIERLLNKGLHASPWSEIDKALENLKDRPRAGSLKSLPMILRGLRERFPKDPVPIRRAITFLDSSARDLAERNFFHLRLYGEEVSLPREGERFLDSANCLSGSALRSREAKGSRCICQLSGDTTFCPRSRPSAPRRDPCLDASESPMCCCSHDPAEVCRLEALLDEEALVIDRLLDHARTPGFSRSFQKRSRPILAKLEALRDRSSSAALAKNESCAEEFSEILILLECGENARLVSYDDTYDELAAALGWGDFRIHPGLATAGLLG